MNVSNLIPRSGRPCVAISAHSRHADHGVHVVAPLEAKLHVGQVAVAVLGKLDEVVGPRECGLQARATGRVDIAANQRRWMADPTSLPTKEGPQAQRPGLSSARPLPIADPLRAC